MDKYMKNAIGIKLDVPFMEKELAKSKGVKWAAAQKTWFYPLNDDLKDILNWINPEMLVFSSIKSSGKNIKRYFMQIRKGYKCHKCDGKMDIIVPFEKPPKNRAHTQTHEYALIWGKPKSFVAFAESLYISMKFSSTSVVEEKYAMHICPKCNAIQGDFYVYEDKDCRLPEINSFFVIHDLDNDTWVIENGIG
jgi:Zn finger protein HypA/HybF involved in hydrogenase expression